MLLGGGYEFSKNFQFEASLYFGKASDKHFDYNLAQFSVGVTAFIY